MVPISREFKEDKSYKLFEVIIQRLDGRRGSKCGTTKYNTQYTCSTPYRLLHLGTGHRMTGGPG